MRALVLTQPGPLNASIAITERMGGVYFIHIDGRPPHKRSFIPASKVAPLSKLSEQAMCSRTANGMQPHPAMSPGQHQLASVTRDRRSGVTRF